MDQALVNNHGAFIWRIANLLRGTYKPAQYGSPILPFVVLRRLDCLLEPTKAEALARSKDLGGLPADIALPRVTGLRAANRVQQCVTSPPLTRLPGPSHTGIVIR